MESSGTSIDWIVLADLAPGREPSRRFAEVDKDLLGEFLKACAPSIEIDGRTLAFQDFRDFRPERLARQLPDAAALLGLRQQALDLAAGRGSAESLGETLRKLAAYPELAAALEEPPKETPPPPPAAPAAAPPAGGSLFDLVDTEGSKPPSSSPPTGLGGLLDEIVGKGPAGGPPPAALRNLAGRAEAAAGRALRAALHHPAFRRLEAAWRGLRHLIRSLDFRAGARLRVLPASADRLVAAVKEDALPLAEESRAQGRLAVLLLDFPFDASAESLALAAAIAGAAAARPVPVIASAERGFRTDAPAWDAFRSLEAARWLALGTNAFLLRAPYGKESDPVREFPFEEAAGAESPLLWGRPGWILGALVSAAVVRTGWGVDFAGREAAEALESLPVRPLELRHGEVVQIPLEEDLGDAAARALDGAGLLPLACRRNSDRPFAAGSSVAGRSTLRDALFAAQVSATLASLLPNLDPTRGLPEIARTIGAGLELMGLGERGPEFAAEAVPAEDPPRVLVRVKPRGPRLRGLADLEFTVPIPLH